MDFREIVKRAIDLHVHVGPEIIPRKFDVASLIQSEKGKLGGAGIKNHFFPTIPMDPSAHIKGGGFKVVYSVVLNQYVGGLHKDIIIASSELAGAPIIVWLPTIHANNFLIKRKFEVAEEWIDPKKRPAIKLRRSKDVVPVAICDKDLIPTKELIEVLQAIKDTNSILATGHISWQESVAVLKTAHSMGIRKIIVTHPIYELIDMPIEIQKELSKLGALMEQSFSMYSIDKVPMGKIAEQIKAVGPENCIMSSDVGQIFSPNPSESLIKFMEMLSEYGFTAGDFEKMLVDNPNRLVK